jgi:hypothetical protein
LSSTAFAIAADALPAPMTIMRPAGGAGRCGGMHSDGCAAAIAALNMRNSSSREACPLTSSIPDRKWDFSGTCSPWNTSE